MLKALLALCVQGEIRFKSSQGKDTGITVRVSPTTALFRVEKNFIKDAPLL